LRVIVNPNVGFRAQLLAFEEALESQRAAAGLPPLTETTAELMRAMPAHLGYVPGVYCADRAETTPLVGCGAHTGMNLPVPVESAIANALAADAVSDASLRTPATAPVPAAARSYRAKPTPTNAALGARERGLARLAEARKLKVQAQAGRETHGGPSTTSG
jgi:hypothetical protein